MANRLEFDKIVYEEHLDVFGNPEEIEEKTREIELELGGKALIPPSSTYHRFITGLTGGKMSSSKPESFVSLMDPPTSAKKKIMKAVTGGRVTAEEQRKLGGEPERCAVFEFYNFHLVKDDKELAELEAECREGKILCGECKKRAAEMLESFLKEHQAKMEEAESKLDLYTVIV